MHNYKKKLKIQKHKSFKQIESEYNYLFFCRYYDLKSNEIINLKIFLKNQKIKFKTIKQNLLNETYGINGQGSLLIIFFDDFINLNILENFFKSTKKIEPLYLLHDGFKVSVLKLKKIHKSNIPLPYVLKSPLSNIYQTFLNIKNQ